MIAPNEAQVKSAVRWVIGSFGGFIAGWAAKGGFITSDQVMSILNSEVFVGIVVSGVGLVWGIISKTKPALVAQTERLPGVEGVVTSPNTEGRELAEAVPSANVVPAGTARAAEIARAA